MLENFQYNLVSSTLIIDGNEYTTYGISSADITFFDVSLDKQKVEKMIEKINNVQLESCHLMYFIEDEIV